MIKQIKNTWQTKPQRWSGESSLQQQSKSQAIFGYQDAMRKPLQKWSVQIKQIRFSCWKRNQNKIN